MVEKGGGGGGKIERPTGCEANLFLELILSGVRALPTEAFLP